MATFVSPRNRRFHRRSASAGFALLAASYACVRPHVSPPLAAPNCAEASAGDSQPVRAVPSLSFAPPYRQLGPRFPAGRAVLSVLIDSAGVPVRGGAFVLEADSSGLSQHVCAELHLDRFVPVRLDGRAIAARGRVEWRNGPAAEARHPRP